MRFVVVGCGWLGLPLAVALAADGHEVIGTTTRGDRIPELERAGIEGRRFVLGRELQGATDVLDAADRLIMCVPPSRNGGADAGAMAQLVEAAGAVGQIVQTSSTGVYADRDGHPIVDEDDAVAAPLPAASSDGAATVTRTERLLAIEASVRAAPVPTTVLRLAGLWGYGRHPARFLAGREVPGGDAPVNLVHRDDVVAAVGAVTLPEPTPGTFNVVADAHPPKATFYRSEAERLGVPAATFGPGPSPGKRVSGARLAQAVGVVPRWRPGDPAAP